jgi:hypothetical protein
MLVPIACSGAGITNEASPQTAVAGGVATFSSRFSQSWFIKTTTPRREVSHIITWRMSSRTHLVLTVHGINSDGEWQEDAGRVLDPHCTYVAYKYRSYRYWGFVLQLVAPVPALLALIFLGAAVSQVEAAGTLPPGTLVTAAGVELALALGALQWSLATAMKPVSQSPTRSTFFVLLAVGAASLMTWVPFRRPGWSSWAVPAVAGIALFLVGLLEVWGRMPRVNSAKTWLVPLGACLVSFAAGTALRRLVEHGFVSLGLSAAIGFLPPAFFVLAGLAAVAALIRAVARRRACVTDLQRWILEQHGAESPTRFDDVHLIAHSFGTFLVGAALEDWRRTQEAARADGAPVQVPSFRTVVVVGSAMRAGYRWVDVINAGLVHHVRNEVGGRDGVIRFAGMSVGVAPFAVLGWHWHPFNMLGLGAAGYLGFEGPAASVHDVRNSLEFCEQCRIRDERQKARVHNVWLPTFRHSDGVQATERAGRFWLPLILGFEPWEYWDFRRLCSQGIAHAEEKNRLNGEIEELTRQQRQQVIKLRKAVDREDDLQTVNEDLRKLEEQLHSKRNELLRTDNRVAALMRQLGERSWDWTYAGEERASFHFYIADKLEDAWFTGEKSDHTDAVQSRSIVKGATERAPALMPRIIELSVIAAGTLQAIEQRPRERQVPLTDEERSRIACLDPRNAVAKVVAETPLHRSGKEAMG